MTKLEEHLKTCSEDFVESCIKPDQDYIDKPSFKLLIHFHDEENIEDYSMISLNDDKDLIFYCHEKAIRVIFGKKDIETLFKDLMKIWKRKDYMERVIESVYTNETIN